MIALLLGRLLQVRSDQDEVREDELGAQLLHQGRLFGFALLHAFHLHLLRVLVLLGPQPNLRVGTLHTLVAFHGLFSRPKRRLIRRLCIGRDRLGAALVRLRRALSHARRHDLLSTTRVKIDLYQIHRVLVNR